MCGVWQKMQMRVSVEARVAPGPLAERLCLVLTMSAAVCADTPLACANPSRHRAPIARHERIRPGLERAVRISLRDPEHLDAPVVGVTDV